MPRVDLVVKSPITKTARVLQASSMFDLPPTEASIERWSFDVDLPSSWNVGLIVGPSGAGKSTVARALFGDAVIDEGAFAWSSDRTIIDDFPAAMSVKEIIALLSSVGFSSPPSWLRPFAVLSTGQRFRVHVARALAEQRAITVIDEFTSVVDRTVAQIGSHAIARSVRQRGQRFVAVSCHSDIIDWLQPDWIIEMPSGTFTARSHRRRPDVALEIQRCDSSIWHAFAQHHYLNTDLHKGAACFVASIASRPVAFAAVLSFPHQHVPGWRGHRTVCLPDFQGVGIGNKLSEFVAACYSATRKPFRSVTSHPAMIRYRNASPLWAMVREPSRVVGLSKTRGKEWLHRRNSCNRSTATFQFVGEARPDDARALGILH